MSVKQVPPPEIHNRFDVVHARLLTVAMNYTDWDSAVRNLARLLKPGGALQWKECGFVRTQYLRGAVDTAVSTARFMASQVIEALKGRFSSEWNTLPQIMESEEFVEVIQDIVSSDKLVETREAATINGLGAISAWAKLMSKRNAPCSIQMDELSKLKHQANMDVKSGCYVGYDVCVAFGFKSE